MPNWVSNELLITGDKNNIDKLYDDITVNEGEFSLANTMPTPPELTEIHSGSITIDDVQYTAWYEDEDGTRRPVLDMTLDDLNAKYNCNNSIDWQYLNWGTKWGDLETRIIDKDDKSIILTFQSAWGEPFLLLQHIAETYKLEIVNKFLDEFEYDLPEPHQTDYPIEDFDMIKQQHKTSFSKLINNR
jgi:hypothetical protein